VKPRTSNRSFVIRVLELAPEVIRAVLAGWIIATSNSIGADPSWALIRDRSSRAIAVDMRRGETVMTIRFLAKTS
jgi:hypothetical protein